MKSYVEFVKEAKSSSFNTYSEAVQFALKDVEKRGYEYDEDEYFHTSTHYKKPSVGKTTSWKIPLMKNGKETRRVLVVNVYGLESGKYELNHYIG